MEITYVPARELVPGDICPRPYCASRNHMVQRWARYDHEGGWSVRIDFGHGEGMMCDPDDLVQVLV